jgi:hypothetical protein
MGGMYVEVRMSGMYVEVRMSGMYVDSQDEWHVCGSQDEWHACDYVNVTVGRFSVLSATWVAFKQKGTSHTH